MIYTLQLMNQLNKFTSSTSFDIFYLNKKYRELKDKRSYWLIGKNIVDAQGGEARAKYGNELIKRWSIVFINEYGKGYDSSNLRRMRQYYLEFPKCAPVGPISWKHIKYILPIKDVNARNYYINQVILNNLLAKDLDKLIKSKAFDRLSYADKENIALITVSNNKTLTIEDIRKIFIIRLQGFK